MTIKPYAQLAEFLAKKVRGRKHSTRCGDALPEIWCTLTGDKTIVFHFEPRRHPPQHVATLYPDNTLVVDIHGWHTQASCKIIERLTPNATWIRKGVVWTNGVPVTEPLRFEPYNDIRRFVIPQKFVTADNLWKSQRLLVGRDDLSPKVRLMMELGTYNVTPAISKRVVAFAKGEIDKSQLGDRDIYTVLQSNMYVAIQARIFEEMI